MRRDHPTTLSLKCNVARHVVLGTVVQIKDKSNADWWLALHPNGTEGWLPARPFPPLTAWRRSSQLRVHSPPRGWHSPA